MNRSSSADTILVVVEGQAFVPPGRLFVPWHVERQLRLHSLFGVESQGLW